MDAAGAGDLHAKVEAFFADAKAYADWMAKAESDRSILVAGDKTRRPTPPCAR